MNHNLRRKTEALLGLLTDYPTLPALYATLSEFSLDVQLQPSSGDITAIYEAQDILGAGEVATAYTVAEPRRSVLGGEYVAHSLTFTYYGVPFRLFAHVSEQVPA